MTRTASPAEQLLAVQLERAGIPFETEYRFAPEDWCRANGFTTPTGRPKKWRADFAIGTKPIAVTESWTFSYGKLLVEIEGGIGGQSRHSTYVGFTDDCQKYAAAAILGYRIIRATTEQVNDGTALSWIRAALGQVAA